jgi:hypothetical protein
MSQPTLEPQLDRKQAKAQAAAAKAYAKAQGNWFSRHKILTGLLALVLVIIVAAVASSGGGKKSPSSKGSQDSSSSTSHKGTTHKSANSGQNVTGASAYGTAKLPLQNGDWRMDSIQVKNDGLGDFGGTARVTYTGSDKNGGNNLFTITLFKGKNVVATFDGAANTVMPGTTVTVNLLSTDKYVGGPFKYDFQNDL